MQKRISKRYFVSLTYTTLYGAATQCDCIEDHPFNYFPSPYHISMNMIEFIFLFIRKIRYHIEDA